MEFFFFDLESYRPHGNESTFRHYDQSYLRKVFLFSGSTCENKKRFGRQNHDRCLQRVWHASDNKQRPWWNINQVNSSKLPHFFMSINGLWRYLWEASATQMGNVSLSVIIEKYGAKRDELFAAIGSPTETGRSQWPTHRPVETETPVLGAERALAFICSTISPVYVWFIPIIFI